MSDGSPSARVRERLSHPIIDSDAHALEHVPIVRDEIARLAGRGAAERFDVYCRAPLLWQRFTPAQRRQLSFTRRGWWVLPGNALDLATAMAPRLLHDRLDEMGIDFCVVLPSFGSLAYAIRESELRQAACRAFNGYMMEHYGEFPARMTPAALIPMDDPVEAVAELRHAVRELGFRVALLPSYVVRSEKADLGQPRPYEWLDAYGADSLHDYDPVWSTCVELGVSPVFHRGGIGWGSRNATHSFVQNHIGHFAAAGEAICRSLVLGGAFRRFPSLRCGFFEGGVVWGIALRADLIRHLESRGPEGIARLDPANVDRRLLVELLRKHAHPAFAERIDELEADLAPHNEAAPPPDERDEFAASGLHSAEDVDRIFRHNVFFGCESDDPLNALAFDRRATGTGGAFNAMLGSDIGHFDVADMRRVLADAHAQVERGGLRESDFRAFSFGTPARFWAGTNPAFFDGTRIADAVRAELAR